VTRGTGKTDFGNLFQDDGNLSTPTSPSASEEEAYHHVRNKERATEMNSYLDVADDNSISGVPRVVQYSLFIF
jgi:hypothetical protein